MERLTTEYCGEYVPKDLCSIDRLGGADDCELCCDYCKATVEGNEDCRGCAINQCFNKLGQYEDLGLTPEQIREIDKLYREQAKELGEYKNAEKQGLLLRLPCKRGDIVYAKMKSGEYEKVEVKDYIHFSPYGFCIMVASEKYEKRTIPFSEFGKTVFLTKPENQEALQKRNEKVEGNIFDKT